MRTLLDERYAPITSEVGFLEAPLEEAERGLAEWRRELGLRVAAARRSEPFPEVLRALEPLTAGGIPRELFVEHRDWTAYFNSSLRGTDAHGAMSVLAKRLGTRSVVARAKPHTMGKSKGRGRYGSVQFELFGPNPTNHSNYVRAITATNDGGKWVFFTTREPLPFENLQAYEAPRVRDRFTSELLAAYCRALGIELFDPAAYGPGSVLVESSATLPKDAPIMSLAQVQEFLGIEPGQAAAVLG